MSHDLDGTLCKTCGVLHDLPGIDFDALDEETRRVIQEAFESMPPGMARSISSDGVLPRHGSLISKFFSVLCDEENANRYGPMLRAIMVLLDENNNGRASRLWKFFECERRLIITHNMLRQVNTMVEGYKKMDEKTPRQSVEQSSMEFVQGYTINRLTDQVEDYVKVANNVNIDPCQQIIDSGTYPDDVDEVHKMMMGLRVDFREFNVLE